jgi:hypothetical protein
MIIYVCQSLGYLIHFGVALGTKLKCQIFVMETNGKVLSTDFAINAHFLLIPKLLQSW